MKCLQNRENCIFIKDGRCNLLTETHFKRESSNKMCPFFKARPDEPAVDTYINGVLYRSVKGFGGDYFVSMEGQIVNWMGRPLKLVVNNGYLYVHLRDGRTNRKTKMSVAKIMADAYIPGSGKICFRDGDTLNVDRWNLYRRGEDGNEEK